MTEALNQKVERLLGDFYRKRGFAVRLEGDQCSLWAAAVYLESPAITILIARERGDELIDLGIPGNRRASWPIGHLVAYLQGKEDSYPVTDLETQAEWLLTYANKLLDPTILSSKEMNEWAVKASRRMWGQRTKPRKTHPTRPSTRIASPPRARKR